MDLEITQGTGKIICIYVILEYFQWKRDHDVISFLVDVRHRTHWGRRAIDAVLSETLSCQDPNDQLQDNIKQF